MKNKDLISIIVPIYNAEAYLEKCVMSLLQQTYENIEIILVNDGSKDKSGVICDRLSVLDSRVKVIHQNNAGVSVARNNGLKNANGSFIGFVDADDYIDLSMYQKMIEFIKRNDADVVYCDLKNIDNNDFEHEVDTIYSINLSSLLSVNTIEAKQLVEIAGSVCRGLYRKNIVENYNIRFSKDLKFSEDRLFNLLYLSNIKNIYYLKEALYYRLVDNMTTVQRYHENHFEAVKKGYDSILQLQQHSWISNEYKKVFDRQFINNVYGSLNNYFYKTSTLSNLEKYIKVKSICNDEMVVAAIKNIENKNIRDIFLRNKCYFLLSIITKLGNIKNHK